ncbi:hypothetical protein GH733_003164 [Mirounga leonina]|nr:hypothetical protein GH733_003164 [Mirounga leonina]
MGHYEFFHFVLLCFAIGTLLVCYHYYADWFMSLGVGLLTFASLETVGIYFGLGHGEVIGKTPWKKWAVPQNCNKNSLKWQTNRISQRSKTRQFTEWGTEFTEFPGTVIAARVYRIHSVLHGFIPLFQKLRLMGNVSILPMFTIFLPIRVFGCKRGLAYRKQQGLESGAPANSPALGPRIIFQPPFPPLDRGCSNTHCTRVLGKTT